MKLTFNEFKEYIEDIENKKPFNCPLLVVLPKNVNIDDKTSYSKNTLICKAYLSNNPNSECELESFGMNKKGELEAKCMYNHSKFLFEIKRFESSE